MTYDLFARLQLEGLRKCTEAVLSIAVIHSRIGTFHIADSQHHCVYGIHGLLRDYFIN